MKYIKRSFINAVKYRKLKGVALILTWVLPVVMLINDGMKIKYTGIKFELWAIPCLGVVLLIYYKKLRQWLREVRIAKRAGGFPIGPLWHLINTIMSVGTLYIIYCVFKVLTNISNNIIDYLLVCMACLILGGLCNIIDSIGQLSRMEEEKDEEKQIKN